MKQAHVRTLAAALGAITVATLLSACAGGSNGTWISGPSGNTTPGVTGPRPMTLDPSLVGNAREVPTTVRTPLNQSMFLLVSARGVQIYECTPRGADFGWTFRAPEAVMTDASGVTVGKHYAGPTWEATDGSTVVGTVTATSPGTDASAIPWLLLSVKSTTGTGVLTQTKSVQRLQTIGGIAPTTPCAAMNTGETARVPYAATYAFFRAAP